MEDRREEIFNKHCDVLTDTCGDSNHCLLLDDAKKAMDEYAAEMCLELLEYMAKNNIHCVYSHKGEAKFDYKGEYLTKEKLFENFL